MTSLRLGQKHPGTGSNAAAGIGEAARSGSHGRSDVSINPGHGPPAVALLEDSSNESRSPTSGPMLSAPLGHSGRARFGSASVGGMRPIGDDGRLRSLRRDHVLLGMVAARQDPMRKV